MKLGRTLAALFGTTIAITACERPQDEFIRALPQRDEVMIEMPSDGRSELRGNIGTQRQGIVGQPAEWYSNTYYAARDLNGLAAFIIQILEAVTKLPPTDVDANKAVWGPLSDEKEPNEWRLTIEKKQEGDLHYVWAIEGKHKSQGDDGYLALAGGAFEPGTKEDFGKGWFIIDFTRISTLDPTTEAIGQIGYALERDGDGLLVLAHLKGTDANGNTVQASYAYGEDNNDNGFIVFQMPGDIHEGQMGLEQAEDILIHTRFSAKGGRADIFAKNGDLEGKTVIGSQCWGTSFVSSYEEFRVDSTVLAAAGEAKNCVFDQPRTPTGEELPDADQVQSPYTLDEVMR